MMGDKFCSEERDGGEGKRLELAEKSIDNVWTQTGEE